jgi:peptide/nickel transport system permease protein
MTGFIVNRLLTACILLVGLSTGVFFVARLSPGDPFLLLQTPTSSAASVDAWRHKAGLDQPLLSQYIHWMEDSFSGSLGISIRHQRPVEEVILTALPSTAFLAGSALVLELILGVTLGGLAAKYNESWIDKIVSKVGLVAYTLPTFWVGMILLAIFSYWLGWFPSSQLRSIGAEHLSQSDQLWDYMDHLFLPALALAIPGAGSISRYFRDALLKVRKEEFLLYAQSLSMPRRVMFLRYELPNACASLITLAGLELGTLLAGVVVTETTFALPGMGRLTVSAIFSRDYPLVMGCTLVSGIAVILGNFIADVFYGIIDPRVRVS